MLGDLACSWHADHIVLYHAIPSSVALAGALLGGDGKAGDSESISGKFLLNRAREWLKRSSDMLASQPVCAVEQSPLVLQALSRSACSREPNKGARGPKNLLRQFS